MRTLQSLAVTATALLSVLLLGSLVAAASGKAGHVAYVHAQPAGVLFRAHPAATWQPVMADQPIPPGAMVKTGAREAILHLPDGTLLGAMPESAVQIHAPTEVNLDPGPTTRVSRADLKNGSFRVQVPVGGRPMLAMVSRNIMVAFNPGTSVGTLTPEGLLVQVHEGSAKVANAGRWMPLSAGQYLLVRTQGRQEGPKNLPLQPSFLSDACRATPSHPCAIAVVVGDARARLAARWNPSAPGCRYAVLLTRSTADGEVILKKDLQGEQTALVTDPLPVGNYWIALQTINADGIKGPRILRPLRVVRLLAELGATWVAPEQLFVLPQGRKVKIDGGAGLQVSYSGQSFVPSIGDFAFVGSEWARSVTLRLEGDPTDTVAVGLEPYGLHADVLMTPSAARWPGDRVVVDVRLTDPRHRVDLGVVRPRLLATINSTPVQVGLTKVGVVWRAEVPPRNGGGPWTIRVEVLDQDDTWIGRGVLNVDGRQAARAGR